MRRIEKEDVIMMDNLMTIMNKRAILREVTPEECSAVHQARLWGNKFRDELEIESRVNASLASAKCVDPGPPVKVKKK